MKKFDFTVLKEALVQTVMLGNSFSAGHKADSVRMIEFVLRLNGITDGECVTDYAELINGDLSQVRISAHYSFLAANRKESELEDELQGLYDIKGSVLIENPTLKEVCAYNPVATFMRAKGLIKEHTIAAYNFLGTLLALGIGTAKNTAKAKDCFIFGSYYGDAYAMKALAAVCEERGEDKEAKKWRTVLASLDSDAGVPSPDIENENYETGLLIYFLMTAPKRNGGIDVTLVEALNNDSVSFTTKKELVAVGRPVELFDKLRGRLGYGFKA